jgi:hypothetical protein
MTKLRYKDIVVAVNKITQQYTIKLTLRQIFYRLVSKKLIPNTLSSYKGLSSMLVKAREERKVDEDRIEDRTRKPRGKKDFGWDSPEDFLTQLQNDVRNSWKNYTKTYWEGQPERIIIGLEKDALSKLFEEVINPYNIQLFPTKGYGSYTFIRDIAKCCHYKEPTTVLYFGDLDPSGKDIKRDFNRRVLLYGAKNIKDIRRIAITEDQVKQYDLPKRPDDKKTLAKLRRDTRTAKYGMEYAVELDALEPEVLQKIIRDEVGKHIVWGIWNKRQAEIEEGRKLLKERVEKVEI